MRLLDGILPAAIYVATSMLLSSPAVANECDNLHITVSGVLSNFDPIAADVHATPGYVLDIPLDKLAVDDATFRLKLSRVGVDTWAVSALSSHKSVSHQDLQFNDARLIINFDSTGNLEAPAAFTTPIHSSSEFASESAVSVAFNAISVSDEKSRLMIKSTLGSSEQCFRQGQLDIWNEVNGGKETVVKYYSGEDGRKAMLAESSKSIEEISGP